MKKYIVIAILLWCFVVAFASADLTPEYVQMLEDMNIMSAIIDKTLAKAFPGEYKEPQFIFPRESDKCQGFYLKDYGVLFMVDVNFPVSKTDLDKEEKQAKSDNLWEATKQELSGADVFTYSRSPVQHLSFDQAKVDRIKDVLLKVIGDYSNNIRQLRPDSTITIIIKGGSQADVLGKTTVIRPSDRFPSSSFEINKDKINDEIKTKLDVKAKEIDKAKLDNKANMDITDQSIQKLQSKEPVAHYSDKVPLPESSGSVPSIPVQETEPMVHWNGETPLVISAPNLPSDLVHVEYGYPLTFGGYGTSQRIPKTTMIISVKKRDVMDLKADSRDGKTKYEDFAKRAEIIQY